MKRIHVCADDYGFNPAVNQAIMQCIDAKRISGTGCMVLSPYWMHGAAALRERVEHVDAAIDIGLHLDLNEFAAYAPQRSLGQWIAASYLRRMGAASAKTWVAQQLDAFEAAMQRAPDFVDGHQHVHQLPVIRDALVDALVQRYGTACALRCTDSQRWRGAKAAVITRLGATALRQRAKQHGLRCNADFAGVYDFSEQQPYAQRVTAWLASLPDAGMLMTHPGGVDDLGRHPDAIAAARVRECAFWLSPQAQEICAVAQVQLGYCRDWPLA